jgi:hypothetical protein
MNKIKPTPTPWMTEGRYVLNSVGGISIACTTQLKGKNESQDIHFEKIAKANAAFIVKAVNCHEELINVVKALSELMGKSDYAFSEVNLWAHQVIAKAEGKE